MSSIGGAGFGAGLYAAISTPTQSAAEPEEAKDKKHHLKGAKGFTNPWDSYTAMTVVEIFRTVIWYVLTFRHLFYSTSYAQTVLFVLFFVLIPH